MSSHMRPMGKPETRWKACFTCAVRSVSQYRYTYASTVMPRETAIASCSRVMSSCCVPTTTWRTPESQKQSISAWARAVSQNETSTAKTASFAGSPLKIGAGVSGASLVPSSNPSGLAEQAPRAVTPRARTIVVARLRIVTSVHSLFRTNAPDVP